jgi:hypothetical protein
VWQHGCGATCGRKRGADCPTRHGGGLVVAETKSRSGRRVVGLPAELVAALGAHREAQDAQRDLAADLWRGGGWVFAQPTGKPVDPRVDYAEWQALFKAGQDVAQLGGTAHRQR